MSLATLGGHALATITDPTGRRRAAARRKALVAAAGAAGGLLLGAGAAWLRRHRHHAESTLTANASEAHRAAATADGQPLDRLAADAQRSAGSIGRDYRPATATARRTGEAPGHLGHVGFGVGGSIPGEPDDDGLPTGGGSALGHGLRGGGAPGEIVTGAGEAMSNLTTPAHAALASNGNGAGPSAHGAPPTT